MPTETALRNLIVAEARKNLGHAYRDSAVPTNWPPAQFDCSVFTSWCWGRAGLDPDRAAKAQPGWPWPKPKKWHKITGYTMTQVAALGKAGCAVSFAAIEPGDLLYYSAGKAHHVTIYIGDGKVIHAAGTAYGVILSNVVKPGQVGHGGKKFIGAFSAGKLAARLGLLTATGGGSGGTGVGAKPVPRPPVAGTAAGSLKVLRPGSKGPAVVELRRSLDLLETYTPEVAAHVDVFVRKNPRLLPADGTAGPATYKALTGLTLTGGPALRLGFRGGQVGKLRQGLGLWDVYTDEVARAVDAFVRKHPELAPANKTCGPQTYRAITGKNL